MSVPLEIKSGYNHFDPLRDFFIDAERPNDSQQDPAVQARCGAVVEEILKLCCQMGSPHTERSDTRIESGLITLSTPGVRYTDEVSGSKGVIWLEAHLNMYDDQPLDIYHPEIAVALCYRPWNADADDLVERKDLFGLGHDTFETDNETGNWLMWLMPNGITFNTSAGERAGGQSQLNYMRGVADDIRTVAFPRNKVEEEERRKDEAARNHRLSKAVLAELAND